MNIGQHIWSRSIGPASDYIRHHPDLQGLDLDFDNMGHPMIRPSPLLTSQLLFLAESGHLSGDPGGPMFRAYDKSSGEVLAEIELPAKASGAPMTYFHNGHQYIVVAVATAEHPAELVALALPQARVATRGMTAQPIQVENPRARDPGAELTAVEQSQGEALFAQYCAACHGMRGSGVNGGSAPVLTGMQDVSQVQAMISRGGVEMPAFELQLAPAQMELLSRYVVQQLR